MSQDLEDLVGPVFVLRSFLSAWPIEGQTVSTLQNLDPLSEEVFRITDATDETSFAVELVQGSPCELSSSFCYGCIECLNRIVLSHVGPHSCGEKGCVWQL